MFNDVADVALPSLTNTIGGSQYFDNLQSLQIGSGSKLFRGDSNGIWLGAQKFADAPFSVDMEGNIIATTLQLGNYLSKTDTSQSLTGSINVGGTSVVIDGVNGRYLTHDGSDYRFVAGNV